MSDDQYTMDDESVDAIIAELDTFWLTFSMGSLPERRAILQRAINQHMPCWFPEGGGP